MSLSVLSLNVWNNSGPYDARRQRMRAWIERLNPDLIGLQEVVRGDSVDELNDLVGGLGYYLDYARAVPFWLDRSLEFGNAVASRWPIVDREVIQIPDAGDDEHRVALSVTIDAPFGPVGFTTTHLNWKPHHGWARERQVVAVCALARRRRPRGGFPPIVAGDFNAVPESTEIRYVTGLHALDGGSVAFRDAWATAGDGSLGATWSNRNAYARVALEPDRRIDYIFTGPPAATGVGLVEQCRIVCDDERDGVWPSDHFGLYAEIRTAPLPDAGASANDQAVARSSTIG